MTRCIIVDDEPLAIEIVEAYLNQIKGTVLLAKFTDPVEAFTYIQQTPIDVIFLDLDMPLLNGMELLRNLKNIPHIIITTAYREYAVESFELDVLDYLVKPFSFPRFLKAVNKVVNPSLNTGQQEQEVQLQKKDPIGELWIKVDKSILRIMPRDIFYIESLKDYIRIVMAEQKLITYQTLHSILTKLSDQDFLRVHKSYVIQVNKIKSIEGNRVHLRNEIIPIGRNYRKDLLKRVNL
jgi:DNA-binding LytR/AlgR family response regulator